MTRTDFIIDLCEYIETLKEFSKSNEISEYTMKQFIRKESIDYNFPLTEQEIDWIIDEIYQ